LSRFSALRFASVRTFISSTERGGSVPGLLSTRSISVSALMDALQARLASSLRCENCLLDLGTSVIATMKCAAATSAWLNSFARCRALIKQWEAVSVRPGTRIDTVRSLRESAVWETGKTWRLSLTLVSSSLVAEYSSLSLIPRSLASIRACTSKKFKSRGNSLIRPQARSPRAKAPGQTSARLRALQAPAAARYSEYDRPAAPVLRFR